MTVLPLVLTVVCVYTLYVRGHMDDSACVKVRTCGVSTLLHSPGLLGLSSGCWAFLASTLAAESSCWPVTTDTQKVLC